MAESTLSLEYADFMRGVAYYLGFGNKSGTSEGLTSDQQTLCDRFVQEGYRQFLFPENGHVWSFLKPIKTIDVWATLTTGAATVGGEDDNELTVADDTFYASMVGHTIVSDTGENSYTIVSVDSATTLTVDSDASGDDGDTFTLTADGNYRLPDDFGGIEGPLTFTSGTNRPDIEMRGEPQIRQLRQRGSVTGRPRHGAVRPVAFDPTLGQRYELMLYPTPNAHYELAYTTNVLPDKLTTTNKYPYGGMIHGNAILESCLAVAEAEANDGEREHRERYKSLLASSVRKDRTMRAAENLGYMSNPDRRFRGHERDIGLTTYGS